MKMKRTEMIELMMSVITENSGKRVTDYDVIEQILTVQEGAGMTPPSINPVIVGTKEEIVGMRNLQNNRRWENE